MSRHEQNAASVDLLPVFDAVLAADGPAESFEALATGLRGLGFDQINYGYFDPAAAERENARVLFLSTMSRSWLQHYAENDRHLTDPHVVKVRQGNLQPYKWSRPEVLRIADRRVRSTAHEIEEAGLAASICVPLAAKHSVRMPVAGITLGSSLSEADLLDNIGGQMPLLIGLAHMFHGLSLGELWREGLGTKSLTPRERDCLHYLAAGLRQDRIAEKMGITLVTVELHLRNARRSLKAATNAQAIARGIATGEIDAL
jgi:DNA-binding CsgD family transcriptional regulator